MLSLISYPSKIALQSEQCHTKLVISHWQLPCLTLIKAAVDSRTTSEQQPFISTGEFILICNNLITVRYNNIALCVRYTSTAQSILLSFMSLRNFFFWAGKPSKAIGSHSREQQKTYLYETQRKTVDRKHGDSFGYIACPNSSSFLPACQHTKRSQGRACKLNVSLQNVAIYCGGSTIHKGSLA